MYSPDDDPFDLPLDEEEAEQIAQDPYRLTLVLWLVVIGLAILFITLNQFYNNYLNDSKRLFMEVVPMQQQIAAANTPAADVQALINRVSEAKQGVTQLQILYPTLAASHYDWSGAMIAAADYDSQQIVIKEVIQDDDKLLISGEAINDAAVVNYAQKLAFSGSFIDVEIRSMSLSGQPIFTPTPVITPTATPEPSATPTESAPAGGGAGSGSGSGSGSGAGNPAGSGGLYASPTPQPVDIYEVDDVIPGVIFLGEIQTRNFYPNFDQDTMRFLVKSGRTYKVSTFNLAPGVDTFVEISFDDKVLVNDDGQPGTLGSEIIFRGGVQDTEALIRVSNLGIYAPDKIYQISVVEILPTATPTGGPLATTIPVTPTPPPVSPTPTPIRGDRYEPNNTVPSMIAVGETQNHTFDPQGDVDKIAFVGKKGRQYKVFTSGLGLGVDTFLLVENGADRWENDDLGKPGSGIFASGVCVDPAADGPVTATLTNVANQFGPNRPYSITVREIPKLEIDQENLNFGVFTQGGPAPVTQTLTITSTQVITWSHQTEESWIQVVPVTTTTPSTAAVSIVANSLPVGNHEGIVEIAWDQFCKIKVKVVAEVSPSSSDSGSDQMVMAADRLQTVRPKTGTRRAAIRPKFRTQTEVSFVIVVQLKRDLVENNE